MSRLRPSAAEWTRLNVRFAIRFTFHSGSVTSVLCDLGRPPASYMPTASSVNEYDAPGLVSLEHS